MFDYGSRTKKNRNKNDKIEEKTDDKVMFGSDVQYIMTILPYQIYIYIFLNLDIICFTLVYIKC